LEGESRMKKKTIKLSEIIGELDYKIEELSDAIRQLDRSSYFKSYPVKYLKRHLKRLRILKDKLIDRG
jgi:predicted RNase H-like nuclease (RuvC/YqgF family)